MIFLFNLVTFGGAISETHRKPRKIGTFSVRFVLVHSGVQQMSHLGEKTTKIDGWLKVSKEFLHIVGNQ